MLGPECVTEVLGPDTAPGTARPPRRPRRPGLSLAGLGFLAALLASVLPWSNQFSSHDSGIFGGWGFSPLSWSLVAAVAAGIGVTAWAMARLRPGRGVVRRGVLPGLAVLVDAGGVLYPLAPPPFSHPWLGPWVALGAATLALGGTLWDGRRALRPRGRAS